MFTKTENGRTLVGNNEDWINPFSKVWFKPAEKDKFGAVYFGFARQTPFAGINEKGLIVDFFTANNQLKSNGKEKLKEEITEKILQGCSTVKEALTLLNNYDPVFMYNVQIMLVDKTGDSAIYEGNKGVKKKALIRL
jgi:penicillin V acylase-like amidase (Ntn superfamily)